jgi:hypothetical protein
VPDEYPDLIVEDVTVVPSTPHVNSSLLVEVTIKNQGPVDVPLGNNFFADLYVDPGGEPAPGRPGDVQWGVQYFWVAAGESHILTTTLVFTDTGTHYLYARVDTDGTVKESNEQNNLFGPFQFQVETSKQFRLVTRADFQKGFGTLDLTGDEGYLQPGGLFDEPGSDPAFYTDTDQMVNDITYTIPITASPPVITDTAVQVKPVIVHGSGNTIYAVWEDARSGSVYNRDIYFARSDDAGQTWATDVRVNQDPITNTVNQLNPQMAYDTVLHKLYVVWQDNRNGNYDIYFAYSDDNGATWVESNSNPINDDAVDPNADQLNPSISVIPGGHVFVAWQDQRNGNNDIYMAMSDDGGKTWSANEFVTDDPLTTNQSQTSPSITAGQPVYQFSPDVSCGGNTAVVVVWEDDSESSTPISTTTKIYGVYGCVTSGSGITTAHADFSLDFSISPKGFTEEHDPNLAASDVTIAISHTETISVTGVPTETQEVVCTAYFDVKKFHVVWQHIQQGSGEGSIYYSSINSPAQYRGEVPSECYVDSYGKSHRLRRGQWPRQEWYYDKSAQRVDGCTQLPMTIALDPPRSCIAPDAPSPAPSLQPVWRGDPTLTVDESSGNLIIAWSDARNNYDGWRRDLYVSVFKKSPDSADFSRGTLCDRVLNNNLHIYRYLNAPTDYGHYRPASANIRHPAVVAFGERVYVVWDDDRRGDPLQGGQSNRDIFFARSRLAPEFPHDWSYISPVFDAGGEADWYTIDWWGITRISNTLTLQVRYGNDPNWPRTASPVGTWTPWTGVSGARSVYDAPGQHLRDPTGKLFPTSRYIQFRVSLTFGAGAVDPWVYDSSFNPGPCLSEVTIHYEGGAVVYLPLIAKSGPASSAAVTPNDPYYGAYQWNMEKINAPQAWGQSDGSGQTIAVLDSGVDLTHPDLVAKLVTGYDFVNDDSDPSDDEGHGTHVAGIAAAATNNGIGVAGTGWGARIMPIKVLDATGLGFQSDIASGVEWAADQGARILNLSLGGPTPSTAIKDAIDYAHGKGALVVASSGNSFDEGNPVIYPAAYNYVLAVAATDNLDQHASYSSSGSYVDVAAPGGDPSGSSDPDPAHWIESTFWRGYGSGFPVTGYNALAGTSQAAPHVAGLAALILARNSTLTNDQVANIIQNTAEDLGSPGRDDLFGYGRINAGAAVAAASTAAQAGSPRPAATPETADLSAENLASPEPFRTGAVLVRFENGVNMASRQELFSRLGVTVHKEIPGIHVLRLDVPAGQEVAIAQALAREPGVRYAELDHIVYAH